MQMLRGMFSRCHGSSFLFFPNLVHFAAASRSLILFGKESPPNDTCHNFPPDADGAAAASFLLPIPTPPIPLIPAAKPILVFEVYSKENIDIAESDRFFLFLSKPSGLEINYSPFSLSLMTFALAACLIFLGTFCSSVVAPKRES
jgi:hypothetical protein